MKRLLLLPLLAVLSGAAIHFAGAAPAAKPTIVLISGEFEYESATTLPVFKKHLESAHGFNCVYLERKGGKDDNDIPGLEALERADLAIIYIRRMTLPEDQLARLRKYAASGKPIIGLRTASHAFQNWKEWDQAVLGGNYQNHHGNQLATTVRMISGASANPLLRGVAAEFPSAGSLYKNTPLAAGSVPLLTGHVEGKPAEPVAWTHSYQGARVFYTSLGHPKDFENDSFRNLVVNAIYWALNRPPPVAKATAAAVPVGVKRVDVAEFEKLWRELKLPVLDVRTSKEFAAGHIPGAKNLDVNGADFEKQIAVLEKSQTYLIHCAAGVRSQTASSKMKAAGFTSIIDLAPGFKGWQAAGKPVEK